MFRYNNTKCKICYNFLKLWAMDGLNEYAQVVKEGLGIVKNINS